MDLAKEIKKCILGKGKPGANFKHNTLFEEIRGQSDTVGVQGPL